MKILVIGCGTFGANVAVEMDLAGHEITVVETKYENFNQLPDTFRGKRINGDALVKEVLDRAHADQADAVILTTSVDTLNLTLARMFQEKYQQKNIVALNTKLEYRLLFDAMEVQTVSMISWGVLRIEEKIAHRMGKSAASLDPKAVGVYNVVVPDNGLSFSAQELQKVSQCLIFSITHENKTRLFTSNLPVVPGDILHVSANTEGLKNLFISLGVDSKEVAK